jgi:hypothetical protein
MYVKPALAPANPDRPDEPRVPFLVRDPIHLTPMPAQGRNVPDGDLYWHKLLLQGDIVEAEPPATQE